MTHDVKYVSGTIVYMTLFPAGTRKQILLNTVAVKVTQQPHICMHHDRADRSQAWPITPTPVRPGRGRSNLRPRASGLVEGTRPRAVEGGCTDTHTHGAEGRQVVEDLASLVLLL